MGYTILSMAQSWSERPDIQFSWFRSDFFDNMLLKFINDCNVFISAVANKKVSKEKLLNEITTQRCVLVFFEHIFNSELNIYDTDFDFELSFICTYINRLYYYLLQMLDIKSEKKLETLNEYMQFCLDYNIFFTEDGELLNSFLMRNHSDPDIYITAANFEFENKGNKVKAQQYIRKGIENHSDCISLYLTSILIEIKCLEYTYGKSINSFYEEYHKFAKYFEKDLKYYFMLLHRVMELKKLHLLHYEIIWDIIEKFKFEESMWQELSKLDLSGFISEPQWYQFINDKYYFSNVKCKTYSAGLVKYLSLKLRHNLWNMIIQNLIGIWKSNDLNDEIINSYVCATMCEIFRKASDNRITLQKIDWETHIHEQDSNSMKEATATKKDNVNVWKTILNHYMKNDKYEMENKVFQDNVRLFEEKLMPLWLNKREYCIRPSDSEQLIKNLENQGLHFSFEQIVLFMKIKYYHWKYNCSNCVIKHRELLNELENINAPHWNSTQELCGMITIYEENLEHVNINIIRNLYYRVFSASGDKDGNIWAKYMQFEYTFGNLNKLKHAYVFAKDFLAPELLKDWDPKFKKIIDEYYHLYRNVYIGKYEDDDDMMTM